MPRIPIAFIAAAGIVTLAQLQAFSGFDGARKLKMLQRHRMKLTEFWKSR
jgi:hypothetical protein